MFNPENQPKKLFTVGETANFFRVHPRTVLRWIEKGKLDAFKPVREYRISGEMILSKLEQSRYSYYL